MLLGNIFGFVHGAQSAKQQTYNVTFGCWESLDHDYTSHQSSPWSQKGVVKNFAVFLSCLQKLVALSQSKKKRCNL